MISWFYPPKKKVFNESAVNFFLNRMARHGFTWPVQGERGQRVWGGPADEGTLCKGSSRQWGSEWRNVPQHRSKVKKTALNVSTFVRTVSSDWLNLLQPTWYGEVLPWVQYELKRSCKKIGFLFFEDMITIKVHILKCDRFCYIFSDLPIHPHFIW